MVKSNAVKAVKKRETTLDFVGLDHGLKDILDGELLLARLGEVRSYGKDRAEIVFKKRGSALPFKREREMEAYPTGGPCRDGKGWVSSSRREGHDAFKDAPFGSEEAVVLGKGKLSVKEERKTAPSAIILTKSSHLESNLVSLRSSTKKGPGPPPTGSTCQC